MAQAGRLALIVATGEHIETGTAPVIGHVKIGLVVGKAGTGVATGQHRPCMHVWLAGHGGEATKPTVSG